MPQPLAQGDAIEEREADLDLDAIGDNSLLDRSTKRIIASNHQMVLQSASMALASIPTGVIQQIAQAQRQLLNSYIEPIRKVMEVVHERVQHMVQYVAEAINRIVKPLTFIFVRQPIYYLEPQPVEKENHFEQHLSVQTNEYGFFIIGGKQLNILHPTSSRCGRLFATLLKHKAQVVDYKTLKAEVGSGDLDKTFKDLKYQLKQQGYQFSYSRPRTKGIALISVSKLQ